jgi:hypothetical protein
MASIVFSDNLIPCQGLNNLEHKITRKQERFDKKNPGSDLQLQIGTGIIK